MSATHHKLQARDCVWYVLGKHGVGTDLRGLEATKKFFLTKRNVNETPEYSLLNSLLCNKRKYLHHSSVVIENNKLLVFDAHEYSYAIQESINIQLFSSIMRFFGGIGFLSDRDHRSRRFLE